MGSIGAPELIIVLVVVLLLFGSTKLPKLARSIGEASKEFKKGVNEGAGESADGPAPTAATPTAAPVAPGAPMDDKVTISRAEFEALQAAQREAEARKDAPPPV